MLPWLLVWSSVELTTALLDLTPLRDATHTAQVNMTDTHSTALVVQQLRILIQYPRQDFGLIIMTAMVAPHRTAPHMTRRARRGAARSKLTDRTTPAAAPHGTAHEAAGEARRGAARSKLTHHTTSHPHPHPHGIIPHHTTRLSYKLGQLDQHQLLHG